MKDSVGNELPKPVMLKLDASPEEMDKALTINSFLLAATMAINKGKVVIYDENQKEADIEGFIINHF